jgi:hypothetical protein
VTVQKKALMLFGLKHQLCKLAEECAKLTAAALRLSVALQSPERLAQFFEELADVEIMIEPMRLHFGDGQIDAFRAKKLTLLASWIRQEYPEEAGTVQPNPVAAEPKARKAPPAVVDPDKELLSVADAARLTGMNPQTLRNAINRGSLESTRENGKVVIARQAAVAFKATHKLRKRKSA